MTQQHITDLATYELKVGAFKPEYPGKLNFYINTINEQIKGAEDKPTIGVLLCKTPNETVVKYSLKGVDTPMGVADYEFAKALPKQLKAEMPSIEELEKELEEESEKLQRPVDKKLNRLMDVLGQITDKEAQKQKEEEDIRTVFNKVSGSIETLVREQLKDVVPLFENFSFAKIINDGGSQKLASAEVGVEGIYSITLTVYLDSFKKFRTKDFNISKSIDIIFKKYKDTVGFEKSKVYLVKFDRPDWRIDELQEFADKCCVEILEDITQRLETLKL